MIDFELFPDFEETDCRQNKINERWSAKDNVFGLEYCEGALRSGKYEIPMLDKYTFSIPSEFVCLSELRPSINQDAGVSAFEEDYILESLWKNPNRFIPRILEHPCAIEPDFSLKIGMPLAAQIANCYRSHAIAHYLSQNGANVIPCMKWSNKQSYEFCFDGYTKGGVVAVSTIGTLSDERSQMYFLSGFEEMLRRISPEAILLYGDVNYELMSRMPEQLDVHHVPHSKFQRARKNGSKRSI